MFELDDAKVKLTNVNIRPELHGEDKVPAMDLDFAGVFKNDVLTYFDGFLKGAFYKPDPEQLDLQDPTKLKFPQLGTLKWEYTGLGYTAELNDGGLFLEDRITLLECKLVKFKLQLQEGGSVLLSWQLQCHPSKKDAGNLYAAAGKDVQLTLQAPEEPEFDQE